jgi:hypothetical protein
VSNLLGFVGLAILLALSVSVAGCGGGGGGQSAQGIIDQDLAVMTFLIVKENPNGSVSQIGGPNSTNVLRDARLLFTFNAPVDIASVNDRTLRVGIPTGGGLFEKAQGIYYHPVSTRGDRILNQVIFNPTFTVAGTVADNPEGFDRLAVYQVLLPSVLTANTFVRNLVGDGLVTEYSASFETGGDYADTGIQPQWEEYQSSPLSNSVQVDAKADIVVAFDQPMKRDSFVLGDTFVVQNTFDGSVPLGTLRYSTDLTRVIFRPVFGYGKGVDSTDGGTKPLDPQEDGFEIQVTVSREVTNLSGNPTPREIKFKFRTKYDATQPEFGDIRELFANTFFKDSSFVPVSAPALWNDSGAPGLLTGTFTSGSVAPITNNAFVTLEPWAVGNVATQWQALYYSTEVGGSSRTITGFDWMKYATSFATTCQTVSVYMGHSTSGSLSTNFAGNYSGSPTHCVNGVTYQIAIGTFTWQAGPTFTSNFAYDGSSNLILEITHAGSSAAGSPGGVASRGYAEWLGNNTGGSNRNATTQPLGATGTTRTSTFAHETRFNYLIDQSEARSLWYDSGLTTPQYLGVVLFPASSAQPSGTQANLTFQGAPELPLSGGLPDVGSASAWEPNLVDISGYRFVRFMAILKGNGQTKQVPTIDELIIPYIFFTVN